MFSKTNNDAIQTREKVHMTVKLLLRTMVFTLILGHGLMAFCDTESELKANVIYTFAKSAEIPQNRLGDAATPYVIGVFGGDTDFVDVLKETTAGKSVGSHPIRIKHLSAESELGQCNVVFFRGSSRKHSADAIHGISPGIVLVGEDQGFLGEGGMINLVTERGKLHFEINKGALDKGHVRLDQRLMALARGQNDAAGARKVRVNVNPEYPDVARRLAIKGTVQLKVKVSGEGTVKGIDVVGGNPVLVEAAISAVRQWRYESTGKESTELAKITF